MRDPFFCSTLLNCFFEDLCRHVLFAERRLEFLYVLDIF